MIKTMSEDVRAFSAIENPITRTCILIICFDPWTPPPPPPAPQLKTTTTTTTTTTTMHK